MPSISIKNLTKKYGEFVALDNFSTEISDGGVVGLLGPNGAGKSTFLRMLTQIYKPTSGRVLVNGEELEPKHRQLFGYLPEDKGLYPDVNLKDQLTYFAQIKGVSGQIVENRVAYWLEKFEMQKLAKSKTKELSKGMQQKIQFIAAVIADPEIVILDEPLSGLDPVNSKVINEYILEAKNEGKIVIFSTHRMEQAEEICDNILLINKGKKVLDGSLKQIKKDNFKNSFCVGFEDYESTLDYLEEHTEIEILKQDHQNNSFEIKLNTGNINQIVTDLCGISKIQTFYEVYPSINQIFLNYVS